LKVYQDDLAIQQKAAQDKLSVMLVEQREAEKQKDISEKHSKQLVIK